MRRFLSVLFIGIVMMSAFGCVESAWKKAVQANHINQYKQFMREYPDSPYVNEAQKKVEDIDWYGAEKGNTIDHYNQYLSTYPRGRYTDQAGEQIQRLIKAADDKVWAKVEAKKTKAGYQDYIDHNPDGAYLENAKDWIEKSEWDACNKKDEKAVSAFLAKFPDSKLQLEAKQTLSRIGASEALRNMLETLKESDVPQVQALLAQGADLLVESNNFGTPLIAAALKNLPEMATLLLENHAPVDHKLAGATALWFAARAGNTEVMKVLIKYKADMEVKVNWEKVTPLGVAMVNDRFEAAQTLLEAGADAKAKSYLMERIEPRWISLLLKYGADVNRKGQRGLTALHKAAQNNQLEVARILLKHGADINVQDDDKDTPLDSAAQTISLEVLDLLLGQKELKLNRQPRAISSRMGVFYDNYLKYIESINYSKWEKTGDDKWKGVMYRIKDKPVVKTDTNKKKTTEPLYMVASKDGSSISCSSPVIHGAIYEFDAKTRSIKKKKFTRVLLPKNKNLLQARLEANTAEGVKKLFSILPDLSLISAN